MLSLITDITESLELDLTDHQLASIEDEVLEEYDFTELNLLITRAIVKEIQTVGEKSIREDIIHVADENGYVISTETINLIATKMLDYDYSDYNDYILELIHDEVVK